MTRHALHKLLIVDDHLEMRRTVRQVFHGIPVEFLEAESGEQALVVFEAEHPDWVIMDVRMPGLNGFAAAEAMLDRNAAAQIVLMSQFSDSDYEMRAKGVGARQFVSKEDLHLLPQIVFP